jgi:DNA-binding FrmR family transcriptional regulator
VLGVVFGAAIDEAGYDVNNVATWGISMARLKTKNDFDSQIEASMLPLGQLLLTPDAKANWNNPEGVKAMTMWTDLVTKQKVQPQDDITRRLRRIEGQLRGLQRMVDDDTYCIDVLTQIGAVQAALDKVALGLLDDHTRHCVMGAEGEQRVDRTDEMMAAVGRLMRRG